MYSNIEDVKSQLPFPINDNSVPDDSELRGIQEQANMLINGYIGRDEDLSTNPKRIRVLEAMLTYNWAIAWHEGRPKGISLNKDSKEILNQFKEDMLITDANMVWY